MVKGGDYHHSETPPPNYSAFDGASFPPQAPAPYYLQEPPSGSGQNTKGSKNAAKKSTGLLSSLGMGKQPG
jgi:hypothetical protein